MKKSVSAAVLSGAILLAIASPSHANDGTKGYIVGCTIGKMLGIQMCGELEPGFGQGGGGSGGSGGAPAPLPSGGSGGSGDSGGGYGGGSGGGR